MKKLTIMALVSLAMISSVQAVLTTDNALTVAKGLAVPAGVFAVRGALTMLDSGIAESNREDIGPDLFARDEANLPAKVRYFLPGENIIDRLASMNSTKIFADNIRNGIYSRYKNAHARGIWMNRISAGLFAGLMGIGLWSIFKSNPLTGDSCMHKLFDSKISAAALCIGSGLGLLAMAPNMKQREFSRRYSR